MIELKVEGMTCGHCEASVVRALQGVQGVRAAVVNRATGIARVEGEVSPDACTAAVRRAGFDASPVARGG